MKNNWPIVISIVGWGLWSFINKLATQKLHILHIQLVGVGMAICLAPVYIWLLKHHSINENFRAVPDLSSLVLSGLASLFAAAAGIAFLSQLQRAEAGTTTVLVATYPLLTLILSILFLGEAITSFKIIGSFLIVSGMICLSR
jgi:bacterial/archaeal transporter family protein